MVREQRTLRAVGTMQARQFGGTLPGLLDYWASQTPDSPAIYCNDVETSFGALSEQSMRLASALVQLDVKPGDAVALWPCSSVVVERT
jgi:acyl-CoA synthetase (AMP-forming)/AMP-acid ligase II